LRHVSNLGQGRQRVGMGIEICQSQPCRCIDAHQPISAHEGAAVFKRLAAARTDEARDQGAQEFIPFVVWQIVVPVAQERSDGRAGTCGMIGPWLASDESYRFHHTGTVGDIVVSAGLERDAFDFGDAFSYNGHRLAPVVRI
jgi:hypothetical protein